MKTIKLIIAALLLSVPAAALAAGQSYKIYRITRDADGEEASRQLVETFAEQPAPAVTLGGHLLALHNQDGGEYVADPVTL